MMRRSATRTKRTRALRRLAQLVAALALLSLPVLSSRAAVPHIINDSGSGLIYWGGKYVNIKPSQRGDVIGRRSQVDRMEVIMKDDIVTVKITGPYFRNYALDANRTRGIPPGDLYIASQGWKVKGVPPYSDDVFEPSEGWDHVVSFTNKSLHKLNFSDIIWTQPQSGIKKFRANQAWRGGYGERLDDAVVELTDTYLSFTFSIRNMRLGPEIGLHWTMMCGNDIIEGSAPLPAIPVAPSTSVDPGSAQAIGADPLADEVLSALDSPITSYWGAAVPPPSTAWTVGTGGTLPPGAMAPPMMFLAPFFWSGDDGDDDDGPPTDPTTEQPGSTPTPVGEPPTLTLGLLGMLLLSAAARLRLRRLEQGVRMTTPSLS